MSSDLPAALTIGELARRLNVPIHRVEYHIRAHCIKPSGRAGNCRLFSESDLSRLAALIARIEGMKRANHE